MGDNPINAFWMGKFICRSALLVYVVFVGNRGK